VRAVVLLPTVTEAGGGCGLWWSETMVVMTFMHVGGGLTHVSFRLISSNPGRRDVMIFIYLKNVLLQRPADVSSPVATMLQSSDGSTPHAAIVRPL
jgi:hypothetical protein